MFKVRNDITPITENTEKSFGASMVNITPCETSNTSLKSTGQGLTHIQDKCDNEETNNNNLNDKEKETKQEDNHLGDTTEQNNHGQTVVFTNGCFDVMHIGHLQLLKYAKRYAEICFLSSFNCHVTIGCYN